GHELDDVEGGDATAQRRTLQKLDRLPVGEAARCRADHTGNDRRIEPIAVDGDEEVGAVGDGLQGRGDTMRRDLAPGDEDDAGSSRILEVGGAGAAGAAGTDLDDALDPAYLACAAHRRGEAEADALNLIAPVDMGVDLQHGKGATPLEGLEKWNRH